MKTALFQYRVVLILLGMLGIVLIVMGMVKSTRNAFVVGVALTAMGFYVYFALVIVHVEMRYILVPDMLMSIFASVSIVVLMDKLKHRLIHHA